MDNSNLKTCTKFTIEKNSFLKTDITGYYHWDYIRYKNAGNPDFINYLKNTFNNEHKLVLDASFNNALIYFSRFLHYLAKVYPNKKFIVVMVPRAKNEALYSKDQLKLKEALAVAVKKMNSPYFVNGVDVIKRIKSTKTTHLKDNPDNDGDMPYVGITKDTCRIASEMINDESVLLIDDIYTKTVNIDEDCIQALLDNGAREVIFYAIAKTLYNK